MSTVDSKPDPNSRVRWEYLTEVIGLADRVEQLNAIGDQGWELVAIGPAGYLHTFKRRKL